MTAPLPGTRAIESPKEHDGVSPINGVGSVEKPGRAIEASPPADAVIAPARTRVVWPWIIPLVALVTAAVLLYQVKSESGRTIRVHFQYGDGIQANDPVTYRGVQVGHVRSVTVAPDLDSVVVIAELRPDAGRLAVQGSQFWIVRPEVSLSRVSGLETLLGPRHLEVDPGPAGSKPESQFNGLDRAPLRAGRTFRSGTDQETVNDDSGAPARGLELVLQAGRLGSITATSPVLFRGVRVGSVTGVRLAEDARTVDLTILVEPQYGRLVKSNTRFWNAGGLGVDFGLIHGLTVNAKSIESLITGGVEFATPNKPGDAVEPGHRFKLEDEPEKAWLEWAPPL